MAETPEDNQQDTSKQAVDLNSLSGLDFGPSWADENSAKQVSRGAGKHEGERSRKSRSGGGTRDRRQGGARRSAGNGGERRGAVDRGQREYGSRGSGARRHGESRRGGHMHHRDAFEAVVKIDLYPQDDAFDALVTRLQASARTYQLFEIAHLLLEKPERFVVVVSPKSNNDSDDSKLLYYSVPGHLPFETEQEAINHVLIHHLDLFFDIEEIEVEAPKGNFQMINKCGVTGELLGPPNYHRYQEFLQGHYNNRIRGMSYDRFISKIEGVKEQEQIDAWVESMKKGARYTLKDRAEGEPEAFESLEAVRHFLVQNRKDKIVGSGTSVRFAGRDIERLQKGNVRRSIEHYVEQQRHFPLDTANNIRGRLRRHKFTVYKKGSKGVSYVCAVKRKFRDSKTAFTQSIQDLIIFLEKNPDILASKLPKEYAGIDTEKQEPKKLAMEEGDAGEATEGKATTTEPEASKVELPDDDQKRLNQLMLDLRWLITEGYVTEYGDGRLFAPPPMPEPKKQAEKAVTAVTPTDEAADESATKGIDSSNPAAADGNESLVAEAHEQSGLSDTDLSAASEGSDQDGQSV